MTSSRCIKPEVIIATRSSSGQDHALSKGIWSALEHRQVGDRISSFRISSSRILVTISHSRRLPRLSCDLSGRSIALLDGRFLPYRIPAMSFRVLIASALFWLHQPFSCYSPDLVICLLALLVLNMLSMALSIAIAACSARGTVFDDMARRHVTTLLYVRVPVLAMELVALSITSFFVIGNSFSSMYMNCCRGEKWVCAAARCPNYSTARLGVYHRHSHRRCARLPAGVRGQIGHHARAGVATPIAPDQPPFQRDHPSGRRRCGTGADVAVLQPVHPFSCS